MRFLAFKLNDMILPSLALFTNLQLEFECLVIQKIWQDCYKIFRGAIHNLNRRNRTYFAYVRLSMHRSCLPCASFRKFSTVVPATNEHLRYLCTFLRYWPFAVRPASLGSSARGNVTCAQRETSAETREFFNDSGTREGRVVYGVMKWKHCLKGGHPVIVTRPNDFQVALCLSFAICMYRIGSIYNSSIQPLK